MRVLVSNHLLWLINPESYPVDAVHPPGIQRRQSCVATLRLDRNTGTVISRWINVQGRTLPSVCKYCNDAAVNEESQLECFSVMQLKRLHLRWAGQNIGQQR
jgi:hypothetical protein